MATKACDELRLTEAYRAALSLMHRPSICATWVRADLLGSGLVRHDESGDGPACGRRGLIRAGSPLDWLLLPRARPLAYLSRPPLVLNEQRGAGTTIEGVMRHEELEIAQLDVATHGYTEFAIALAKLLGFDLCSRLKAPNDRHLIVPRGTEIPQNFRPICHASADVSKIGAQCYCADIKGPPVRRPRAHIPGTA